MSEKLHVAVVGYGQVARLHTRILAAEGHHLDWVVGRLPERSAAFAQEYGFARHGTDLDHALADPNVDAVFVCTPSPQHARQAAACLAADKHVLVEIPLAMTFGEGRDLAETARKRGLTLMVGHNHRYLGGVREIRERVRDGDLRIQSIHARYLLLRRENIGTNGYVRSWTDNLLWHHGQHSVDVVLWLLGVAQPGIVEVTPTLALPDRSTGIPMDMSLAIRTPEDQLATVTLSYNSFQNLYDYVVVGEEDTYVMEGSVLRNRGGVVHDFAVDQAHGGDRARVLQNREFAAAIRERRQPTTSADSVLPALDVLQRAQDAHEARARQRGL